MVSEGGWEESAARAKLNENVEEWRKTGRVGSSKSSSKDGGGATTTTAGSKGVPTAGASGAAAVNVSEVLFNVTSAKAFQKLVLDSQVPVVVDVHTDWCEVRERRKKEKFFNFPWLWYLTGPTTARLGRYL
jgi:hypothetical protein